MSKSNAVKVPRGRGRPVVKGSKLQKAYKIFNRAQNLNHTRKTVVKSFIKAGIAPKTAEVYFHLALKKWNESQTPAIVTSETPAPTAEAVAAEETPAPEAASA